MQSKSFEDDQIDIANDCLFDADDMLSEEVEVKFLNLPDVFKTDSIGSDDLIQNDNLPELKAISPTLGRPKKPVAVVRKPVPRKKRKKSDDDGDVDKYVNQLLEEDITASLKSLEKKYKKDQPEACGLCEQCGLSFVNANDYKKHVRSHDDKGIQYFQ